jgi:hypothetical protein
MNVACLAGSAALGELGHAGADFVGADVEWVERLAIRKRKSIPTWFRQVA